VSVKWGGEEQSEELRGSRSSALNSIKLGLLTCLRCGYAVPPMPWGCKNPCSNCGFLYPLGDCSD
jgi:hypothetical protein